MVSNVSAVTIAIGIVLGLIVFFHMASARPLVAQELYNTPAHELIEMAQDTQNVDRIKAIRELAKRPMSFDSVVPVLARLTINQNPRVVAAAQNSLSEIGEPGAEMLKPLFEGKTKSGTLLACSAARWIGPSCKMFLPELKSLLDDGDQGERKAALYALVGIGESGADLIDEVIVNLSDKDLNIRCMACRVLAAYGTKAAKAEPKLLQLLDKGTPSVRGLAAISLASIGTDLTTKDVDQMIANKLKGDGIRPVLPVEHERYLDALIMFGEESKKHLDIIRNGLKHHSGFVQGLSALAIYRITGQTEEAVKTFENLVKDETRAPELLDLLGEQNADATPFIPVISRCLSSSNPETREMALVALMKIGTSDAAVIKSMEQKVDDPEPDVSDAAREALDSLKRQAESDATAEQ